MAPDNTPQRSLKSLRRHELYYDEAGDLIIIVGDTSFRVPSSFFTRESRVFRDRLAEGRAAKLNSDASRKNKSDDDTCQTHTIVIEADEKVSANDFAQLCWVFFNPKLSIYEAPLPKWQTILRLANQWNFAEVKDLAFREIDHPGKFNLIFIDRLVLYRNYKAERIYLEKLYVELLSRPEPLSFEEANKLGLTDTLLISGARERLRAASDRLGLSAPLSDSMKATVLEMVRSIFWKGPFPDLSRLPNGKPGNR
ncbi:hypothetical protein P691DRAFT_806204 [Macrolepiota fuliginosa MF-IS2]|uniref:BTB domain-containing protein n=1 Tax=Macrolepiota fuliginosa MF-IS2 TaxID=1400762 RepID=A0A9P5X5R8_9AGAR|nr:hypothetical protein P691DRAFT_806204 [Macrolepiota fuliginosa MF-IS2]